jgi:SAM-dependent methyltransferase/uncharacterized protein YbaR (Trm112 family)
MKLSALEYLVCLHCHSTLRLNDGAELEVGSSGEFYKGILSCQSCSKTFPIVRGVPRMVEAGKSTEADIRTGHAFAEAWKRFPLMNERYRKQFFDWIFPVDSEFFKDKVVLECGCGKGRHATLVSEAGARAVFAVDIGEAVDVAYANVGHLPNVCVVQADIAQLPFKADFDCAFSVGVLHHMEVPMSGFLAMSNKVNARGSIAVWVYGKENNWWLIHVINPVRKLITSKLPSAIVLFIAFLVAVPLAIYCKFFVTPLVNLRKRCSLVPPIYYGTYLSYIGQFDLTEIHHIVFDHLIAPIAHYISRGELASWFVEADWPEPIIRWHNRNSWCAVSSRNEAVLETLRARVIHDSRPEIGGRTTRHENRTPEKPPHDPSGRS